MSTRELRTLPIMYMRNTRRRKTALDVDLNVVPPPIVNRVQEGTSSHSRSQDGRGAVQQGSSLPVQPIDVEEFDGGDDDDDDDVIIASPRAFAEAKNNSGRSRGRPVVIDVDSDELWSRTTSNNRNKRRRLSAGPTIINCDCYINLERDNVQRVAPTPPPPPPPPPPPEPTFSCPICMGPLVEEMSTKCGHIFCKSCIKTAIAARKKCPTCRRKTTMKDIIRIYLPTTN